MAQTVNSFATPKKATNTNTEKIPLESARAGAEDDSQADYTVTDYGTDMTMSWIRTKTIENSTMSRMNASIEDSGGAIEGKKLQICSCGWQKVTTVKGLRIHQGRKKCLVEGVRVGRIDQYFLRSQSSQSVEVQRPVERKNKE